VIHKRTALPQTEGLFIGAFEKLHPEYPNIELELVRIDTFSSSFPRDPHRYRLVATTNLFGDILSDQASGLAGGVGVAPSLNAGGEHAMAQAVHGTAPDIAGRGIANPPALILSTALLLNWFDLGVRNAISGGATTPDLGGDVSTDAFATTVITALEAA
jgi:isocitrate/isopropylmalate dehydrogenase